MESVSWQQLLNVIPKVSVRVVRNSSKFRRKTRFNVCDTKCPHVDIGRGRLNSWSSIFKNKCATKVGMAVSNLIPLFE